MPVTTALMGIVITTLLAVLSHSQYVNNEKRLLRLRVRDAGSLLVEAVPAIQTPLASAAALADATGGNVRKFRRFAAPYVGAAASRQFVSISLWKLSATAGGPVVVVGRTPRLGLTSPARRAAFLVSSAHRPMVSVIGLLDPPGPRLGYAFGGGGYIAYGEKLLPANRRSRLQSTSAFAGLDYAVYLGAAAKSSELLVTSVARPPLRGLSAAETVPFGDGKLTLVMASHRSLAGGLPKALPWIIGVASGLLTILATVGVLRVSRRRREAERLAGRLVVRAGETRRLYAEQRSIAQTLQHALLPDPLPQIPGLLACGRYDAGEQGVDIGGDWYDLIDCGGGRVLMVVGDVSGRGLRAATTMASLRYGIHAYAAQGDPPATILSRLCRLISVAESGQFATVLLAELDVGAHQITVASAGHLPPLLIGHGHGGFVETEVGLPVGVTVDAAYTTRTVAASPGATLIAFTDGLVERRGESLDSGLERLRTLAMRACPPLPELLRQLAAELPDGPSDDDIAILGVRWAS